MSYEPTREALAGRTVFGSRLKALREERGMTQERLALDAGFDRSFLNEVESGRHSLQLDRVFDLAHVLGVRASDLVT